MTWQELKKKRGFTISPSFTDSLLVTFKTSNISLAHEAFSLMKNNGIDMTDGVCGGKSVGGYYVSGFVKTLS